MIHRSLPLFKVKKSSHILINKDSSELKKKQLHQKSIVGSLNDRRMGLANNSNIFGVNFSQHLVEK